jgi:hypothetical protein
LDQNITTVTQNFNFNFAKWKIYLDQLSVTPFRNGGYPIINILIKLKYVIGGRISLSFIKQLIVTINHLKYIESKSGLKGLTILLKALSISLQKWLGDDVLKDLTPLGPRFARTKGSFLPRIISPSHRIMIKRKNIFIIRFYLTVFAIYRIFIIPAKVKLNTIYDFNPQFDSKLFSKYFAYRRFVSLLVPTKTSWYRSQPINLLNQLKKSFNKRGLFVIFKSGPTSGIYWNSHPVSVLHSIWAIKADVNRQLLMCFNQLSDLYAPFLRSLIEEIHGSWKWLLVYPKINWLGTFKPASAMPLGKLGFKLEAAGKLRVFAMVDAMTQWLLNPLHEVLFNLLRTIKQDGTFHQVKPVYRLLNDKKIKSLYSFDLSSATDRLPIILQSDILNTLFDPFMKGFGDYWSTLLVGRYYSYKLPKPLKGSGSVYYNAGQPMGALSSWAMLAICHHFIVQVSAWRAGYPMNLWFTKYALLGDDLVIGCPKVAKQYGFLMKSIDVSLNLSKSIISQTGKALEFAKRTLIRDKGNIYDVSPIPLKELSAAMSDVATFVSFANKNKLSFNQQKSFLGFGYKTNYTSFRSMSHALKVLYLANISKVNLTSDVLNKGMKIPYDLEPLADLFMKQLVNLLINSFDKERNHIYNVTTRSYPPKRDYEFFYNFSRDVSHLGLTKDMAFDNWNLLWTLTSVRACNDNKRKLESLAKEFFRDFYSLHPRPLKELFPVYMDILRRRALINSEPFDKNIRPVTGTGVLPLQVRFYRTWSKIVHKLCKRVHVNNNNKSNKT